MAINPTANKLPDKAIVTHYTVRRDADPPYVESFVRDVYRVYEDSVTVSDASDVDEDGLFEELHVPLWDGRVDLVGRVVYTAEGAEIAAIASFDDATDTVTLETGADTDLTGVDVKLQATNVINSLKYRGADSGGRKGIQYHTHTPEGLAYFNQRLGAALVNAVLEVLTEMGDSTYTPTDVQAAVQALGEKGINIDTFIAREIEQTIADLDDGTITEVEVGV